MDQVLGQTELLALVFARLPMSKEKVSLQLVSKLWREALAMPAAHSPKTIDCYLPFAGYGISRQVIQALSQYSLYYDGDKKGLHDNLDWWDWLGPHLQILSLIITSYAFPLNGLKTLPVMHKVRELIIDAHYLEPLDIEESDLSLIFPNLESLYWEVQDGNNIPARLERLTKLQDLTLCFWPSSMEEQTVGKLPRGCEVVWKGLDGIVGCPPDLWSQVTKILVHNLNLHTLEELYFDFKKWPQLAQAHSLQSFEYLGFDSRRVPILQNLSRFPLSCKVLKFWCRNLNIEASVLFDKKKKVFTVKKSLERNSEHSRNGGRVTSWTLTRV
jgi:hypothetical protein